MDKLKAKSPPNFFEVGGINIVGCNFCLVLEVLKYQMPPHRTFLLNPYAQLQKR